MLEKPKNNHENQHPHEGCTTIENITLVVKEKALIQRIGPLFLDQRYSR
jgi:hypothetical protein